MKRRADFVAAAITAAWGMGKYTGRQFAPTQ